MKTIELSISGNNEVLGDYDAQIGSIKKEKFNFETILKVDFRISLQHDEVESFIDNLKELLGTY